MATFVPAKINTQYIFYISLVSQANTKIVQANPTLAAADFNVSGDGGALGALGTTPTVTPAAGRMVKVTLSAAEMNFANVTLVCSDNAGAEWCDLVVNIQTAARQIDDLAYPATSGRSMVVDAAGLVDANTVKLGPTGTGTAQTAKDVGGAVPAVAAGASGGLLISGSNSGTTTLAALTITGTTTHTGTTVHTGNVVLSDGLTISAPSTLNRAGLDITGNGTGAAIKAAAGSTGAGIAVTTTAGDGLSILPTAGHAINATANGTTKHGINAVGGATTSHGIVATGGGVGHGILATSGGGATGDGIKAIAASTAGNGMNLTGTTTGNGLLTTGGAGAGGDGIEAAAGGGVPIRGDITGNITGNLSGTVTTVSTVTNQLTAAQVATGVWQDATGADFTTASSIGKALYINNVAPGGSGGLMISGTNSGTTTLGALTITGATTHTGNVVLSDGLTISAPSTTNRAGLDITGNGSGAGIKTTGGAAVTTTPAGHGITSTGGASSTGAGGVAGIGLLATGGAGSVSVNGAVEGGKFIGGGTNTVASNAHGLNIAGTSTGHGILGTSGAGATGDGMKAISAATNGNGFTMTKTGSGNDLNATSTPLTLVKATNITGFNDIAATAVVSSGAITTSGGAVTTVTTLTNLPAITANWLTAAGIAASALNGKGDWLLSSSYTAPPSVASIATGVWTDTTAGDFTTALSIGKSVMNGVTLGTGLTVNALTTNNDKTGYALTSGERDSVADALLARNVAGGSSAGRLVKESLYVLRNKTAIAAGTLTVYGVDDATPAFTAAVTTAAGNPIDSIDPA